MCWLRKLSHLDASSWGTTLCKRNPGHLAACTVSPWWSHLRLGHGSNSQDPTFPVPAGALPHVGKFRSPRNGIGGILAHLYCMLAADQPACSSLAPLPTFLLFPLIWSSISFLVSHCALPSSPLPEQGSTYFGKGPFQEPIRNTS